MTTDTRTVRRRTKWWHVVVVVPLVPLLIAVGVIALLAFAVASACMHVVVWTWWCLRGRDILFVYSDSPIWRDYVEQNILPHLGDRAIVLNWSQRKQWRLSVARLAFHHFGGYRQFNPLAVVFRPFRRTRTFRFWEPFRDFKHGRPAALHTMELEFFSLIGVQGPSGSSL
jgi:hypothetical protein